MKNTQLPNVTIKCVDFDYDGFYTQLNLTIPFKYAKRLGEFLTVFGYHLGYEEPYIKYNEDDQYSFYKFEQETWKWKYEEYLQFYTREHKALCLIMKSLDKSVWFLNPDNKDYQTGVDKITNFIECFKK